MIKQIADIERTIKYGLIYEKSKNQSVIVSNKGKLFI